MKCYISESRSYRSCDLNITKNEKNEKMKKIKKIKKYEK